MGRDDDIRERLIVYGEGEELANRLTHVIGLFLTVGGLLLLVERAAATGDPWRLVSCTLYGTILVFFYGISTVYHTVRQPRVKYLFRVLDHASIFLVIAGTYTPFTLVSLRGRLGWALFGTVWGLAAAGTVFKVLMTGRLRIVAPLFYLGLGWLIVVAWHPLSATLSPAGISWLLAGGLFYSLGLVFFAWTRLPYNHAVWHLFVLAGSACHYGAVLWYVVPL